MPKLRTQAEIISSAPRVAWLLAGRVSRSMAQPLPRNATPQRPRRGSRMPRLFPPGSLTTLATSIFLTLLASNAALAYSGGFAPSGANKIPVLLQFQAGHNPATTPSVANPDHQQPPATSGAAVLKHSKPGERLAQKDDFQQYFDRHFRAQRVINASPQHATNAH